MKMLKGLFQSRLLWIFLFLGISYIGHRIIPYGFPAPESYFVPIPDRALQQDEAQQIRHINNMFIRLANTGDDFAGWDEEQQSFWKYSIAFSAYGLPSAMIIDPQNFSRYKVLFDNMIWKMKSKKVWRDFLDYGYGVDPITIQNIMYKGHLNLMYGLFQLSTGDDRYAKEFTWLTRQIASEMRLHHEGHYEGVTCEPNAWFVECNVIGMLSLHIYDRVYGTTYSDKEVRWSLEFILDRMVDPETGLFYRVYFPHHDSVEKTILGYNNAWILTFMNPLAKEEMSTLYPSFKENLTRQLGPYATVKKELNGEPDMVAHVFGLWAAKEFKDAELYGRLRNAVDKFAHIAEDDTYSGLSYRHKDGLLVNGPVVASKLHLGWDTILDFDWGHPRPDSIPDVEGMSWRNVLPDRIYAMGGEVETDQKIPLTKDSEERPCPSCFWGQYNPKINSQVRQCAVSNNSSCNLDTLIKE